MKIGRGYGLPDWVSGHLGLCPECKKVELIIELKDAKGTYFHCVKCSSEFETLNRIQ